FHELEEEETTLESVYLKAMAAPAVESKDNPVPSSPVASGIRAPRMFASIREQGGMLRHALPFYVSSWWRRGDLSWVMYLNAFVLLLVVATSLFGQLPGVAGQVAQHLAGGNALQAGLLLPLFFLSFALLESIKSSIGIWWEKAQGSLEVLLYTPVDDPSIIWLEVLPGAIVSTVWVTLWTAAGLALLSLFGEAAPWDLLPVFGFVAAVTSYWAAMGRMLGFMLFPREGAAGGAWSFLLSPISAAVADLPLALFVFRSPLAPIALLLPLGACLALTIVTGATFDRERLLETGVGRDRERRRRWVPAEQLRRHLPALAFAAFFLLGLPEVVLLPAAAALWGAEIGFGPAAPLQAWLGLAGGIILLALTLNTAAGLPLYSALAFGAGSRIERLRAAWADYFALYRGLVIPVCAAFGLVVVALLIID